VQRREKESDFAMLAKSMENSFALGSLGLCVVAGQFGGIQKCGTPEGPRTYCYAKEDRFEKGVVLSEGPKDLGIGRDIDEDGQSILSYGLEW